VVPDAAHRGMWRVQWPDGRLSDTATTGRMLSVSTSGCCARLSEPRSVRGCVKKQKGSVVPLTSPTNPARHSAQRFEPQQNLCPMLKLILGGKAQRRNERQCS
jgi:hypothetical protein